MRTAIHPLMDELNDAQAAQQFAVTKFERGIADVRRANAKLSNVVGQLEAAARQAGQRDKRTA